MFPNIKNSLKTLVISFVLVTTALSGSVVGRAATSEVAFPDNTVKLTVCNYKFNFTKYFQSIVDLINDNPYDQYDPAGGTRICYVTDNFVCNSGATVGGVPVLGLFENTVNGITYKPQGDITQGTGMNYCLNASIGSIFKAIAPSNNANLIPQIYNVSNNKTGAANETYYVPGAFDDGLCYRKTDGSVEMKPEIAADYNSPNEAIRNAIKGQIGTRNCNVTQENREIYQFRYVIEYPSNDVCNTYFANLKPKVTALYDANPNDPKLRSLYRVVSGKTEAQIQNDDILKFYTYFKNYNASNPAYGSASAGKVDCPTFYKSAFGSKFGSDSIKGVVATASFHLILNESYTAYVGWRKVESGTRLNDTDELKKSWDGFAAFPLN